MNTQEFLKIFIESLESISELYRNPYEDKLYERIICYEFYHQFRIRMEKEVNFVLHGELEKNYRGVDVSPDFVFHIPGHDRNNIAVIEIKSMNNPRIADDLKKLSEFETEPFCYTLGLLVIFGKGEKLNKVYNQLLKVSFDYKIDGFLVAYDNENGNVVRIEPLGKGALVT